VRRLFILGRILIFKALQVKTNFELFKVIFLGVAGLFHDPDWKVIKRKSPSMLRMAPGFAFFSSCRLACNAYKNKAPSLS
jgi:hypothetical protein